MTELLDRPTLERKLPQQRRRGDESDPVGFVRVRDGVTVVVAGGRFAAPATARLVDLISAIAKDGGPIWMDLRQVTSLDLTSARLLSELCARRGGDLVRLVSPPDVVLVNLVIADAGRFIWHIAELDEEETELVEQASREAFHEAGRA